MSSNVKYIVSYSKVLSWYDVYETEHTCFDSKEDAIKKFESYGGHIDGKTYNCNYGGYWDEDPEIDVYITRIELEIKGRRVK